jgi:peptidoglycan-associated lipoprotein
MSTKRASALALAICLSFFAAGCKKKIGAPPPPVVVKPQPPPPAKPAAPIVKFFTAEPGTIERGQSSTLRWEVTGAENVSINQGLGAVGSSPNMGTISGNRAVFPSSTTTYTLTASNGGGSVTESVTVNVTQPAPAPPPTPQPKATFGEMVARDIKDIYFDFDKSDIREDARNTLTQNADKLKAIFSEYPNGVVTIEGHADERGSAEYNLGLGDRRALAAKEFLVQLGVSADRLRTLSYGKERPQCTESSESCWQQNRRDHFTGQ